MWLWHAALRSTTTSIEKRTRRVNTLTEAITPIAKQAASVSCTEKLSFWIRDCLQNHRCSSLSVSDSSFLPTRLLDVGDPQSKLESVRFTFTTELPSKRDVKYIALSHCWGNTISKSATTTLDTLDAHLQGISVQSLTSNFKDVCLVARR
jgi:hypothetical protein